MGSALCGPFHVEGGCIYFLQSAVRVDLVDDVLRESECIEMVKTSACIQSVRAGYGHTFPHDVDEGIGRSMGERTRNLAPSVHGLAVTRTLL